MEVGKHKSLFDLEIQIWTAPLAAVVLYLKANHQHSLQEIAEIVKTWLGNSMVQEILLIVL